MKTKSLILTLLLVLATFQLYGQGIELKSSAYMRVSGAAKILIQDGGLINNGSYTNGNELVTLSGTTAKTISGSSNTTLNDLLISNSGGITTQLGLLTTNNLTIASESKFTIDPTKALTTNGTTALNSAQCLVLRSTELGTASFIDNGTITTNGGLGTAKIERYLTPYTVVSDLKFHFISSPVGADQVIATEFIDLSLPYSTYISDFYKWDEPTNYWINYRTEGNYNGYNSSFGLNFEVGKSYMVAYPAAVTKNFVGVPYTNALGLPLTCSYTADKGNGWNLIGNPFPSSIDWDLVTKGSGMDNALYYYDNSIPGYKYYIQLTGGLGVTGGTKDISPMQGVMVHAKSNTNNTVTIPNAARTHSGLTVFYKSGELTTNILELKLEGNDKSDYARVCFYDLATEDFDGDFDAIKLFSYSSSVPEIYSVTPNNTQLAINTLPISILDGGKVPVGFKVGNAGNYSLTAEKINSFSTSIAITLEDKLTGVFQELNLNPVYNFSASLTDVTDRFVLHFKNATSIPDPINSETFSISATNGNINVATQKSINAEILVTNILGQILMRGNTNGNPITSLNANNLQNGVYIVSLIGNYKVISEKIVVKK
jgi:hypothetical protein